MNQQTTRLTEDAEYREYTKAVNPLAQGTIPIVQMSDFPADLHEQGATRVIPFDLSSKLGCSYPATGPALLSNFIRLNKGERISTKVNATSELYYVIRGSGHSTVCGGTEMVWEKGDFFVLPGGKEAEHVADLHSDAAFYWVHDEPLLRYLGANVSEERFKPTMYKAEVCRRELELVANDPGASDRNRVSILLGNKSCPQTMTITHTLWAMFGLLPENSVQPPHRHNSIALDLILNCKPGCYTLLSPNISSDGRLIEAVRQDWKPYSAFVTPPYYWHAHYNESGAPANVIPIQDAGLHNYLRTLDIEFAHPNGESKKHAASVI